MKILITGCNGFVGKHLVEFCLSQQCEVIGIGRGEGSQEPSDIHDKYTYVKGDFSDVEFVKNLLDHFQPDGLIHLAAQSSVKDSWSDISGTVDVNLSKTVSLYEGIRKSTLANKLKVLSVGSSEEYGYIDQGKMPIRESERLLPVSPYGLSKYLVETVNEYYIRQFGLNILHARPFNHIGPGQSLGFVVPDFSAQIVNIELGKQAPVMNVGNLDAKRDFLDVRDIVRSYFLLLQYGTQGEIYNVCSGISISIRSILDTLVSMSNIKITVNVDPKLIRKIDVPDYYGSNEKIQHELSWTPEFHISTSLADSLNYYREIIKV
ncbi:hypothetical protein SY83_13105 [Paenibacillus swuensis]|uniref:NAD(P)-binding domain-containing protein n=2 Tax=Paenibacillus swuensis TaxID=1178515 RepID=A0A172TJ09_9BACL|nr:hypothetical protein SY83_13105 [Paenibacillus swuensis]